MIMADDTYLPFVIEEATGQNRIKVVLDQHETPFGAARKMEAFRLGGKNERHLIRLDGRQTPIVHTRFTAWKPNVIKGHIRDAFYGEDGRAQRIVDSLQAVLDNQRMVTLTCGPYTWTAFPEDFDIPVEGLRDFRYELKFDILSRPGYTPPPKDDDGVLPFPFDTTAEVREILAEDRANLLAQEIQFAVFLAWSQSLDAIDQALDDTLQAAQAFEAAPAKADAEARSMQTKALQTQQLCSDFADDLAAADPASSMTDTSEDAIVSFQLAQFNLLLSLEECRTRMRSVSYTANQRIRQTTRLYVVVAGDTLESIAERQLGTAARVGDLGLRPQDLKAGKTIRIPA
jgi:hypothetical protein